jgi:large subunit ribosomal protein L28
MAAYCQVTQTGPQFGHNVSHAQNKTKRRFDPNIQKKTYYVPSLKRNVTLSLSARGIKVIDVRGIEAVVAEILARGEKI